MAERFVSIFVLLQNVLHQLRVWNGPDGFLYGYILSLFHFHYLYADGKGEMSTKFNRKKKGGKDKITGLVYLFVHST